MKRYGVLFLVLMLAALMVLPACSKKEAAPIEEDITPAEEVPPPPPPPVEEEETAVIEEEELESLVLEDIYFDFDKYSIKGEFKGVLEANAELLLSRSDAVLVIEGHCDERGTAEYNLALGEKRAKAVIDFYLAYGIDAGKLSMISYGEERPFDNGHDEDAWAMNRRAHMLIKE
ncbi:MAG: peptidoglycan-associated lipoprotein Pal [Candidatus Krumholzibacteria bacterium]|nr:peptidoglycan-associated lipoprotein Pal [Candidatus Krumholzibacteria bacterium]